MTVSHTVIMSSPFSQSRSSLLGLSPKCLQLVRMWSRSHVAVPHSVCSPGSPTGVSLLGWRHVPSALGWPSVMYPTAVCDHSGVVLLGGCHRLLSVPSHCSCHFATPASAGLHRRGWDVKMKLLRECRRLFTGWW